MKLTAPFRFLVAMIRREWWRIRGYEVLTPIGAQMTRLEICGNCIFLDPDKGVCKVCGCDVDAKTALASEACPKRKWPRIKQKRRTI